MPRIGINLDDVTEYIDPGYYAVQVIDAKVKTKENPETGEKSQYINWEMEINEPDSEFDGRKVWLITSLKESALGMLKRFLEACDFMWNEDGSFATESVLGSTLEVQIANEEYNGRPQNPVKSYRPLV